jgi:hypothetical protein
LRNWNSAGTVLNDRNGRPQVLAQLSHQDIVLACCAVNVTEIHMGVRPGEQAKTEAIHTLSYTDVTIAAVALTHGLVLVTDNQKHFPMPELPVLTPPERG